VGRRGRGVDKASSALRPWFSTLPALIWASIHLILYPQWGDIATVAPGRMGPPAATSFTIAGAAIVTLALGRRGQRVATAAGGIISGIAMLSLIGYLFGANTLYALPRLTAIAFQTATILLALGIGLVTAVPDSQLMKMLVTILLPPCSFDARFRLLFWSLLRSVRFGCTGNILVCTTRH